MHELVIRGGTVVDGTGAAPMRADIAIGGRWPDLIFPQARKRRERGPEQLENVVDEQHVLRALPRGPVHLNSQFLHDEAGRVRDVQVCRPWQWNILIRTDFD